MGRILAIDYGTKKIGIAVTDPEQLIATGLTTVTPDKVWEFIKEYSGKENIQKIVVGCPVTEQNKPSMSYKGVQQFVKTLKKKYGNITIDLFDERYTSSMAFQTMIDSGISKTKRRDKELIDKISATILLQSYMEYQDNLEKRKKR